MLIPDNIDRFESDGEKILFLRFKNDKGCTSMYILHSLFTNHHLKNISGELDFLVLVPKEGIFAIEVKHGEVWRKEGTWYFKNRKGEITSRKKSPFSQVDGTINSIRKYVLDQLKSKPHIYSRIKNVMWGTGVAFTSMEDFVDFGTEAHSWQILSKQGLTYSISTYINALSKGWHNENSGKYWYDANLSRPTKDDCEMILKTLRGDFSINYSEVNKLHDSDYLIEEFTKEQFALLDFVNFNKRCLIEGAAGTGKTLMALELFRREVKNGKRIALFCFNNQLGKRLKKVTTALNSENKDKCFVGTLHQYLIGQTKISPPEDGSDTSSFYTEELPINFVLEENNEKDEFDLLILDESQDLLNSYYLEVYNSILSEGIQKGQWVFFGDFSNQAIYSKDPKDAIHTLHEKAYFTHLPPLKINCRNTKNIALLNTIMTGTEKPEFRSSSLDGDSTFPKFPSKNNQLNELESILELLKKQNIPGEMITLLSPKKFEKTYAKDSGIVKEYANKGALITTIHAFKGLENSVVILFDFNEIKSENSQRLLYVGISRARQRLYIVLNKNLEEDYKELIRLNYEKIK